MIHFLAPYMFFLIFLPFLAYRLLPAYKGGSGGALKVPFIHDFIQIEQKRNRIFNKYSSSEDKKRFRILTALVWILLILALMRPVETGEPVRVQAQSRDILLLTDISTSMEETDFYYQGRRLTRLNAVKAVVSDFVAARRDDRIGLILFGTRAYLQTPLTYDRNAALEILESMSAGLAGDSTAIGDALGLAVKTLKSDQDDISQKIIILLTDGENNDGRLSLPEAIDLAKDENVKVYTIGVGQSNALISSFFGIAGTPFDEESLKRLASETKGRYFHAKDLKGLQQIYQAIDRLEPENTEQNFIYPQKELFYLPLLAAVLLALYIGYAYRRLQL